MYVPSNVLESAAKAGAQARRGETAYTKDADRLAAKAVIAVVSHLYDDNLLSLTETLRRVSDVHRVKHGWCMFCDTSAESCATLQALRGPSLD